MADIAEIVLVDSVRPVKLATIPLMILALIGLFVQAHDSSQHDMLYLFSFAPWYCWAGLFIYTLVMRFLGLFYWPVANQLKPSTAVIGIVLWSMIFASGVSGVFSGMEVLYLIPAFLETWILARQIGIREHGH
jgi:chromate transport protein ChrA